MENRDAEECERFYIQSLARARQPRHQKKKSALFRSFKTSNKALFRPFTFKTNRRHSSDGETGEKAKLFHHKQGHKADSAEIKERFAVDYLQRRRATMAELKDLRNGGPEANSSVNSPGNSPAPLLRGQSMNVSVIRSSASPRDTAATDVQSGSTNKAANIARVKENGSPGYLTLKRATSDLSSQYNGRQARLSVPPPVSTPMEHHQAAANGPMVSGSTQIEAKGNVNLILLKLENPPSASHGLREAHYYVEIAFNGNIVVRSHTAIRSSVKGIQWNELMLLPGVTRDTALIIRLMIRHRMVSDEEVGRTEMLLGDLVKRPYRDLVLQHGVRALTDGEDSNVTLLRLGVDKSSVPDGWPRPVSSAATRNRYARHLMIMTRGTRGDVQPFVALARALASEYNWMVTICTELCFRDYLEKHTGENKLRQGCIRFRIAGGNTHKRVNTRISKWAINQQNQVMQNLMLGASEAVFFESEPALFYWAKTMKPDYLMFGFTLASVATIISEALKIPLIGFVLQPTCIPSNQYPPLIPLKESAYHKIVKAGGNKKHDRLTALKSFMENNPITGELNALRKRRGLQPVKAVIDGPNFMHWTEANNTWTNLQAQSVPLVIPINDIAFGGRPPDWEDSTVLTNYIFLRGETVPPVQERLKRFIGGARANKEKVVCLCFSSMPVQREDILRIAIKIITGSTAHYNVSVIALVGDAYHTPIDPDHASTELEATAKKLQEDGRLIIDAGAPFGRLFPLVDVIVNHGGLGTVGEAIMSLKPVIITGVLLLDQRFWGSRMKELGTGPFCVHISKFLKKCATIIDKAVDPTGEWVKNAKIIGKRIADSMERDPTGTLLNAKVVKEMAENAPYFSSSTKIAKDLRYKATGKQAPLLDQYGSDLEE